MTVLHRLVPLFILGVGVISSTGYFLISGVGKSRTIGGKLGESLISASEDLSKWEARKANLFAADDESLVDDLKKIKNYSLTNQKLKDWCIVNSQSSFEDK